MKKNTTTVFKVSENVDIDINIVSCNPLIFLWNNLEFYMCGANFYCRSCVLAFLCFHAWMQFCGYISFVMCGSVVIVVLSLTHSYRNANFSRNFPIFPEGHRRHPGHCLLLSQSEQRVASYEVDIYIISQD